MTNEYDIRYFLFHEPALILGLTSKTGNIHVFSSLSS